MSGSYFRQTRNVELSTIYYIENSINTSWSNVSVVKSFAKAYDVAVPVISIQLIDTNSRRRELGATTLDNIYGIVIDIFAKSDGQRLDLTDFIVDKLKDSWTYYLHSHASGTNEQITRTADGRCLLKEIMENSRVDFGTEVEGHDKCRQILSIRVEHYI